MAFDPKKYNQWLNEAGKVKAKKTMTYGDVQRLQKFLGDASSFSSTSSSTFGKSDYNSASKNYKSFKTERDWLAKEETWAKQYLEDYKDVLGEEYYKNAKDFLANYSKNISEIDSAYKNNLDLYSNFDTEADYDLWSEYADKTEAQLKAEYDWLTDAKETAEKNRHPLQAFIETLQGKSATSAEFEKKYKYVKGLYTDKVNERKASEAQENALSNPNADSLSKIDPASFEISGETQFLGVLHGLYFDDPYPALSESGESDSTWERRNQEYAEKAALMTDGQKKAYTIIFNSQGYEAATKYLTAIDLQEKYALAKLQQTEEWASEHPVWSSLASVASLPSRAQEGALNVARTLKGNYDPYSHSLSTLQSATIRDVVGNSGNELNKILYNGAMSLGDSLLATAISGGTSGFASALLGLSATSDTIYSVKERGGSDAQALISGVSAGIFEGLFERYSLEKLINVAKVGRAGFKPFVANVAKQLGAEASEEIFTDIANAVTDVIVNGEISEYALQIQQYQLQGHTYEESVGLVAKDFGIQLLETAATAAVSAVGGSVTTSSVSALGNRIAGSELRKAGLEGKIIEQAGQYSPESATGIRLADYKKKQSKGKTPSASYLGAVYRGMKSDNINNMSQSYRTAARRIVSDALKEKGAEATDANVTAVLSSLYEQKLTKEQTAALKNKAVAKTLSDLKQNDSFDRAMRTAPEIVSEMEKTKQLGELETISAIESDKRAREKRLQKESKGKYKNVSETGKTLDEAIVKNDGTVFFAGDNGQELSPDFVEMQEETAEAIALSDDFSKAKRKAFFSYLRANNSKVPMDTKHAAFTLAYDNGLYGYGIEKAKAQNQGLMTEEELLAAYNEGVKARESIKAESKELRKAIAKELGLSEDTNGGTFDDSAVRYDRLAPSDPRRVAIGIARVIAEATGRNVVLFDSTFKQRNIEGVENGKYDPSTNTLYLDINAGMLETTGALESAMLPTLSHELVHVFAAENPSEYRTLENLIFKALTEDGKSTRKGLIAAEVKRIAATNPERFEGKSKATKEAIASEEIVARACEDRLSNSKLMDRFIAQMDEADSELKNKFRAALELAIEKIKNAIKLVLGQRSFSDEARNIAKSAEETLSEIQAQYDKLLSRYDAPVETISKAETETVESVSVEIDNESGTAAPMQSERTWNASLYVQERAKAAKILSDALGITQKKAKEYIDAVNGVAKTIADDRARLDYEASSFGSAFVSNVEYGGSFDFTTLCPKRRLYTGTFQEIQRRIPNEALTPDEILEIRNLMIDKGLEATCGLCYVEGSRADMGKFAKEFIRLYKRDFPDSWHPDMVDVNTPDGVEQMRINHPEAYEQYEYFWNHYGKLKDGDPALFASQQKPKLYESRKEYKDEILLYFGNDGAVFKKNQNGGIRFQSFSDFELVHMIDTMQIIMDMATVGLAGQAYTKVPAFADAFGNTGLKINLSLIAKGLDENGKLIFDDREGMPEAEAMRLRKKYSANVGTILVAFTDEQILAAMSDPRVDYVIPFHRSQWKKRQYGMMGLPKGTKDYTYQQNEKYIKKTYHEYRGKMVLDKAKNWSPVAADDGKNGYWDFAKTGKENAEEYLRRCSLDNRRPKFYKFLDNNGDGSYSLKKDGSTDGYWKLLIDFKMYDNNGVGSPQMPVTPDFSLTEIEQSLEEYKGGHQSYPVAWGVVDEFVASRNEQKNTSDRGVMLQIRMTSDNKMYVQADRQVIHGNDSSLWEQQIIDYVNESVRKGKDVVIPTEDGDFILINGRTAWKLGYRNGKNEGRPISDDLYKVKGTAAGHIDELGKVSFLTGKDNDNGGKHGENASGGWNYRTAYFMDFDGKYYRLEISVMIDKNGKVFYNIGQIKERKPPKSRGSSVAISEADYNGARLGRLSYKDIVTRQKQSVNPQNKGTMKSERDSAASDQAYMEAVERGDMKTAQKMVDEAARNAGYTIKAYHGTNAEFTVFDKTRVGKGTDQYGAGFYFASNPDVTASYGTKRYDTYLNIKKPIGLINKHGEKGKTLYDVRITQAQAYQILKRHPLMYDSERSPLGDFYDKYWEVGAKEWMVKDLAKKYDSIGSLDGDVILYRYYPNELHEAIRDVLGYDGVQVYFDTDAIVDERNDYFYVAWFDDQMKSAGPITYDDEGNIIPLSKRFDFGNNDIRYSERHSEGNTLRYQSRVAYESSRDILMRYAEAEGKKADAGFLGEYVNRVKKLDRKKDILYNAEADLALAEDQGRKEDAKKLKDKVNRLSREVNTLYNDLQTMEEDKQLKAIVIREKKETKERAEKNLRQELRWREAKASLEMEWALAEEKHRANERMTDYRNELIRKSSLERIKAKTKLLAKRLSDNNRENHVPDDLKKPLSEFLSLLDFTSARALSGGKETKSAAHMAKIVSNMQAKLLENSAFEKEGGNIFISEDIMAKIDELKNNLLEFATEESSFTLNDMTAEQVKGLDFVMTGIVRALNTIDKAFANNGKEAVSDLAENSVETMRQMNPRKKSDRAWFGWATWSNFTPYTAFKRFGEGGMKIYNAILDGYGQYAFKAKQILAFSESTWTAKESTKWCNDSITVEFNKTKYDMTMAQIMYLYLVDGREQGKAHLDGFGFSLPEKKTKGKSKVDQAEVKNIRLTQAERDAFFNKYIPEGSRQREVADAIRMFMTDVCAEWGNEIGMRLYGYRPFTEGAYVPLVVDEDQLSAMSYGNVTEGFYKVLNMGFTKSLKPNSRESIKAVDLFDIFAAHSSDMAKYSTLGMPLLDAARWFNWQETVVDEDGIPSRTGQTLKGVMKETYGEDALKYVSQWLKDLNNSTTQEIDSVSGAVSKLIRGYKRAAVAGSLKVAALQPMSYYKASVVLSNESLARALSLLPDEEGAGRYSKRAIQYSGMAAWKSLGYYDVNIGRSLGEQIKRDSSAFEKATDFTMQGAAKMDEITIGRLFKACVLEIRKTKDTSGMTQEQVFQEAGKLLDQVIVRTQVVDSTMTRSQSMRSKNVLSKMITSFMSEPTVAINMIYDVAYDIASDIRKGHGFKNVLNAFNSNKRNLTRAVAAYAVTGVVTALLESLFDAWRDDDEDEEEFWQDYLNSLGGNLIDNTNPLQMIPISSHVFDFLVQKYIKKYNNYTPMELAAFDSSAKAIKKLYELCFVTKTVTTKKIRDTIAEFVKSASYVTGFPFYNVAREIENIWNNTAKLFENEEINTKNQNKV